MLMVGFWEVACRDQRIIMKDLVTTEHATLPTVSITLR